MKRKIVLILVLCMLLCGVVSAAGTASLSGSTETAAAGETVTIKLDLADNPGLSSWRVELNWDDDTLTLDKDSINLSDQFSGGMFVENSDEDGKLYLVWAGAENVDANGELVELTFTVSGDAAPGTYPITVDISGTRDQDGDKVAVSTTDASITLPSEEDTNQDSTGDAEDQDKENEEKPSVIRNPFTDVSTTAYYYRPVMWALQNGVTTGMTDTTFGPAAACNRAQTVTFLWRAAGSPKSGLTRSPFTDVKRGAYYYDAVMWAVKNGITTGTSDTTFSPDASVTRGQVVTFLWRTAGSVYSGNKNPFTDVPADAYYKKAVAWAVTKGVTNGITENTFAPNAPCDRGQIVTFLYRHFG